MEIARATDVPPGYLSKVLYAMTRRGVLVSQRGLGGGFSLSASPERISVLDVLLAVDAPVLRPGEAAPGKSGSAGTRAYRAMLEPLYAQVREAAARLESTFRSTSLASLSSGAPDARGANFFDEDGTES